MDNPKPTAELSMLKQYGPDVPDATLQKLVAVFGELRSMADQGTITYPYSVREVVSIVKHLQVRRHMKRLLGRTPFVYLFSLFASWMYLFELTFVIVSCHCFD